MEEGPEGQGYRVQKGPGCPARVPSSPLVASEEIQKAGARSCIPEEASCREEGREERLGAHWEEERFRASASCPAGSWDSCRGWESGFQVGGPWGSAHYPAVGVAGRSTREAACVQDREVAEDSSGVGCGLAEVASRRE